jgi:hypothetical protein
MPMQILRPQWPEKKQVFTKSDGTIKTLSVVITKRYDGETDNLPEKWHERINIALAHDTVQIESDKYVGGISKNGDYTVDWVKLLDYPLAKGAFNADVTPFDGTNSNCMTCDEAQQLDLVNDVFPAALDENTTHNIQVETNDKICCFPATFSITTYNTDFLDSAVIDQTGKVTVHVKTNLPDANGIVLVTYRVTCSDGSYDEATVSGDINGTQVSSCLAPTGVNMQNVTTTSAEIHFTPPSPAPDHYYFQLYIGGVFQLDGNSSGSPISLTGLTPATNYKVFVRSQCAGPSNNHDDSTASNYIEVDFATAPETSLCGLYDLLYSCIPCPGAGVGGHINATYLDCNGSYITIYLPNGFARRVCAMQTAPAAPTYINGFGDPSFSYSYFGPCV